MWHGKLRRRLGVKTKHRKALVRNLVRGLALNRRIETTLARAKAASRVADQMVTIAKKGTLSARRQLIRRLASSEIARLFMEEIAPHLQDRQGGYTRVLKLGLRPGDGAEKALLEFSVPIEAPEKETKKPKKEKQPKPAKAPAEKKEAKPRPEKEVEAQEEKKEAKPSKEKEKAQKPAEKEEGEKRGGFLGKLRKFLTGD